MATGGRTRILLPVNSTSHWRGWSGRGALPWIPAVALLPLAIIVGGALFTIRGYAVTADAILNTDNRVVVPPQLPSRENFDMNTTWRNQALERTP
jgi:hypothetical protein